MKKDYMMLPDSRNALRGCSLLIWTAVYVLFVIAVCLLALGVIY